MNFQKEEKLLQVKWVDTVFEKAADLSKAMGRKFLNIFIMTELRIISTNCYYLIIFLTLQKRTRVGEGRGNSLSDLYSNTKREKYGKTTIINNVWKWKYDNRVLLIKYNRFECKVFWYKLNNAPWVPDQS